MQLGEQAKQDFKQMTKWLGEFFGARGFWFFFPEKKNKISTGKTLVLHYYSCIKRSCARSRAATDPGERHGAWQMRVHADQNSFTVSRCIPVCLYFAPSCRCMMSLPLVHYVDHRSKDNNKNLPTQGSCKDPDTRIGWRHGYDAPAL